MLQLYLFIFCNVFVTFDKLNASLLNRRISFKRKPPKFELQFIFYRENNPRIYCIEFSVTKSKMVYKMRNIAF